MGIRLVGKDVELMKWLNGFGFATIEQIAKKLNCSKKSAYWRMRRLSQHKYIRHDLIFSRELGIYRLTEFGRKSIGDELTILKNVNLNNYRHDLLVINLSLVLERCYKAHFIAERRIRLTHGIHRRNAKVQVPDGVLSIQQKQVAVEVELSMKSRRRRYKIMSCYARQFQYDEVWYFCQGEYVSRQLAEFESKYEFLKIFQIRDYLSGGQGYLSSDCYEKHH